MIGDPLAEAAVANLGSLEEEDSSGAGMTGEAEALRDAPRSVREFFESVAESPDWLNLRYSICASGGTATGTPFSFRPPKGKDYLNFCGLDYHLKSFGRFDKRIELKWFMLGDADQEGDEYFWLNLTNPRVKRWGSNMWESHSGSHHTPATINPTSATGRAFQLI